MKFPWTKQAVLNFMCVLIFLSLPNLIVSATQDVIQKLVSNGDIPQYAASGSYAVGRTWFSVSDGTGKPLILVAWYPAAQADQKGNTLDVPIEYNFANVKLMEDRGNWGSAKLNALPASSTTPYPLVIFSTGFKSVPREYFNIEEHLASYGFIVFSVLNLDEALWSSFVVRPMVTHREIDFAEKLTHQDGSFKGLIDTKHIGVVGHSSGGYTALAAAGAQFNWPWYETYCAKNKGTVAGDFSCPDLLPHKEDILALAHLDSMPKVWLQ